VTGLRLKALHLATSPDFTYSKSYLGLLSAVGSMSGIILCSVPALYRMTFVRQVANPDEHKSKTDAPGRCGTKIVTNTTPDQEEQLESRRSEWIV